MYIILSTLRTHIIRQILLLMCFSLGIVSYAQMKVGVNNTTTLSVSELATNADYVWELYDQIPTDFVKTTGNCPTEKAVFVGGNTGHNVKVKWLKSGVYFYKVTINNSCTNNLKIGKVIVEETNQPTAPKIKVTYNCDGTATLKATNYSGDLLWSTGETSEIITVSEEREYSLVQVVNNVQSDTVYKTVEQLQSPTAPMIEESFINIGVGERVTLDAEACSGGTLVWYQDEELTQKIENLSFVLSKEGEYNYYAVCENDKGCVSPYSKLTVLVIKDYCDSLFKSMKIPQGLSPNGDGLNETWRIDDLKKYCEKCNEKAKVLIFNRRGTKVYEKDSYMFNDLFKGFANSGATVLKSKKLKVGTYFYVIKFKDGKYKIGYLYLTY